MRDGLPDDFCGDEASGAGDNELHFVFCLNKLLNVVVRGSINKMLRCRSP